MAEFGMALPPFTAALLEQRAVDGPIGAAQVVAITCAERCLARVPLQLIFLFHLQGASLIVQVFNRT